MPLVDSSGMIDAAVPESPGLEVCAAMRIKVNTINSPGNAPAASCPVQRKGTQSSQSDCRKARTREVSLEEKERMSGAVLFWIR